MLCSTDGSVSITDIDRSNAFCTCEDRVVRCNRQQVMCRVQVAIAASDGASVSNGPEFRRAVGPSAPSVTFLSTRPDLCT